MEGVVSLCGKSVLYPWSAKISTKIEAPQSIPCPQDGGRHAHEMRRVSRDGYEDLDIMSCLAL